MPSLLLATHAYSTLCMVGLIWFVQMVHYPLFGLIPRSEFAKYEAVHQTRTTWIVAPLMLTEAATAILLLLVPLDTTATLFVWIGLALMLVNWLSTFLIQVPAHRKLSQAFDAEVHRHLVRSNWIRTAAWTARGVLACGLLLVNQGAIAII